MGEAARVQDAVLTKVSLQNSEEQVPPMPHASYTPGCNFIYLDSLDPRPSDLCILMESLVRDDDHMR